MLINSQHTIAQLDHTAHLFQHVCDHTSQLRPLPIRFNRHAHPKLREPSMQVLYGRKIVCPRDKGRECRAGADVPLGELRMNLPLQDPREGDLVRVDGRCCQCRVRKPLRVLRIRLMQLIYGSALIFNDCRSCLQPRQGRSPVGTQLCSRDSLRRCDAIAMPVCDNRSSPERRPPLLLSLQSTLG